MHLGDLKARLYESFADENGFDRHSPEALEIMHKESTGTCASILNMIDALFVSNPYNQYAGICIGDIASNCLLQEFYVSHADLDKELRMYASFLFEDLPDIDACIDYLRAIFWIRQKASAVLDL